MRISLSSFLCLVGLWLACQPTAQQEATSAEAEKTAFFTPNPQPVAEQEVKTLSLGSPAPDFRLPGTDEKWYTLADFADKEVLAVIFHCNHCPTAQAYEDRMIQLAKDYADKGLAVIAISPNSPVGTLYGEFGYTDLDDSFAAMQIRARDKGFNFPYLYDGDTQAASVQFGPVATPHCFVFDRDRKLAYVGRLDAHEKPGTGQAEDIRAAIDDLLAGRAVANPQTKTFGCSTKWGWKTEYKEKVYAEWDARPVRLEKISVAGIQELVQNPSDKLRLLNVWATWCGPCILEYPDLLVTHRMYQGRDFEFISISADKPEHADKALKMLEKMRSPITNYIFDQDDPYALAEALDPEWTAALPYTMLIEPGGKVVYRHQGMVDILELRRAIVEHEMMGRYY